jgi:pimeloyl-ACP methyl ester carboxylesterase
MVAILATPSFALVDIELPKNKEKVENTISQAVSTVMEQYNKTKDQNNKPSDLIDVLRQNLFPREERMVEKEVTWTQKIGTIDIKKHPDGTVTRTYHSNLPTANGILVPAQSTETVALPASVSLELDIPFSKEIGRNLIEEDELQATKNLIERLPYKKVGDPQKLTAEQLDAISKLPPRKNKDGMRPHPAMIPLFRNMALRYNKGSYKNEWVHFRLHTPDNFKPGKKYPMIVWLHGVGECGEDNINQLAHLHHMIPYLVGPKKRDFFMLVPQCPKDHSSWGAPQICYTTVRANGTVECHTTDDPVALGNAPNTYTLAMVDEIVKHFPVDKNRITVAGLSSGGRGVWKILEQAPDRFAAAVPIVSWEAMNAKSLRENPILKKIPIWAVYSSDDHGIDYARKEFRRMKDSGCNAYKTEFGVCGHRAWTPAMLQGDIFGWLLSRAKDGDRFYAAEPSPTNPESIGIFADITVGDQANHRPKRAPKKKTDAPKKPPKDKAVWTMGDFDGPKKPLKKQTPPATKPVRPQILEKRGDGTITIWVGGGELSANIPSVIGYSAKADVPPPAPAMPPEELDEMRFQLMARYIKVNEFGKARDVADKIKNRRELIEVLFHLFDENPPKRAVILDYIHEELDKMEKPKGRLVPQPGLPVIWEPGRAILSPPKPSANRPARPARDLPIQPVPDTGKKKKDPMDECGKEWAMSTDTFYGMFPNGWEKEGNHVPDYVLTESGVKLANRLINAFEKNDLKTMQELCNSFIKLDDIPLGSPWFDTSGGRLQGRIKYTLNEKAKLVVEVLRLIGTVDAESKKEYVELAKKALKRIRKITKPQTDDMWDVPAEPNPRYR